LAKILAFVAQTAATFCKHVIITLVFEKIANFFAENWKNRRKIFITSTPGANPMYDSRIYSYSACDVVSYLGRFKSKEKKYSENVQCICITQDNRIVSWNQSYDFLIYNYNASDVVSWVDMYIGR
jgi:hypothetical protein